MKKYKTHNIDEATFLIIKGQKFKAKRTGNISAIFTFDSTPHLEKCRKEFWSKGAKINIHTWLSSRQSLKNELKTQGYEERDKPKEKKESKFLQNGDPYWYIINNQVNKSLWGSHPMHAERYKDNNVYRSEKDAQKHLH